MFSAILAVAGIYLILYVMLSVPSVQNAVRDIVVAELSQKTGGRLDVGRIEIFPFSEVRIHDIALYAPDGEKCASLEMAATRLSLYTLLVDRKLEFSYAEIIGLDARLWQQEQDSPLNIQFLIDAFRSEEKKKPSEFDLCLRNIVIRRSRLSFDRRWKKRNPDKRKIDFNHILVNDLKADVMLPVLRNDDYVVDLRRLAFKVSPGLDVDKITLRAHITPTSLSVSQLSVKLPSSCVSPADFSLNFSSMKDIGKALESGRHSIVMVDNIITPSDLSALLPELGEFSEPLHLSAEIDGNLNEVEIGRLSLLSESGDFGFDLAASVSHPGRRDMKGVVSKFNLVADSRFTSSVARLFPIAGRPADIISAAGDVLMRLTGDFDLGAGSGSAVMSLSSSCGDLCADLSGDFAGAHRISLGGNLSTDGFDIGRLLSDGNVGVLAVNLDARAEIAGKNVDGSVDADVSLVEFAGRRLTNAKVSGSKAGSIVNVIFDVDDPGLSVRGEADCELAGAGSSLEASIDLAHLDAASFGIMKSESSAMISGRLFADIRGNNADNLTGMVSVNAFSMTSGEKQVNLDNLQLTGVLTEDNLRILRIDSDWLTGRVEGRYTLSRLPGELMAMLAKALPSPMERFGKVADDSGGSDAVFSFEIAADNQLTEFFNLPVRLLTPVPVSGQVDTRNGTARLNIEVPYLQQGKNKLIRDTRLEARIDTSSSSCGLLAHTVYPAKKGDAELDIRLTAVKDNLLADIGVNRNIESRFNGQISLGARFGRRHTADLLLADGGAEDISVEIKPSSFFINGTEWHIDGAGIDWKDRILTVDRLRVWHDGQFVGIQGVASASPDDEITVRMADIDLDFIFDTLDINYVTFGGNATGEVAASGVFGKTPVAQTRSLHVKDLSYNGCRLGDGDLRSRWNHGQKQVEIGAHITDNGRFAADLDGGIWIGRDSLSFDIDADNVNISFLQPFMAAFSSDVKGRASGKAKLYGTFSDIDLTGRLKADTISVKLDYTNVYYSGSDSVFMSPGRIDIPHFRLHDRYGNTANMSGVLTHRYFHDPKFEFRINDVDRLLCYDTSEKMNPDWYGTVFASGSGVIRGWPGYVGISMDMTTASNSRFTFVLNDNLVAEEYSFLTFSNTREKSHIAQAEDHEPDFLKAFRKKAAAADGPPSTFDMALRVTVNPKAQMVLVMDPVAGDKITARGNGAIQFEYNSDNDDFRMIGKYSLSEGLYNFSLQDIILKDFTIRPGSSVSFNGNPMSASLDITASYRVNTNLSDLDKSFSTDRELNRTNVPVDALLMVRGPMESPEISFDIDLPTLTQDVSRKVKSIISTDDMMSRQIIYLLALNRFYTPEYMGGGSTGRELASVASSTLSSQLSSIVGQLTDKVTLAPSFRSDKGDFSDMEVDLALSSRLLDNRLLINGNFGYRDRSTSQTTFVGDFDIEYLLSRSGNLRLKAYNHFNDQNYYLRSALTTQGIGILYRHDFNNPFSFLRRRKKVKINVENNENENDSVGTATLGVVK